MEKRGGGVARAQFISRKTNLILPAYCGTKNHFETDGKFLAYKKEIEKRNKTLPGKTSNAFAQSDQEVGFGFSLLMSDSSIWAWFFLTKSLA
jgi:hypothetical protein